MAKLPLLTLSSGFLSIAQMNQNFQDISSEFQNNVLYRNNPVGEPNTMQNNLDMNSNRILNLPSPVSDSEAARFADVKNALAVTLVSIPALLGNDKKVLSTDGSALVFKQGVLAVSTFAELTIITKAKLVTNDVIEVLGRGAVGDGGEGLFRFDAISTASTDAGTILATDEGGAGRWVRIFIGAVNVKWFGAKLDGVTNDVVAYQAALDTGKNVFQPIGTALITGNLTDGAANQKIFGEGQEDSIVTHNVATGNLFTISNSGISFEDLRLNGDGTFNQSTAVPSADRRGLIRGTGNDFMARRVLFNDGPQNCLNLDNIVGGNIEYCTFTGGVSTFTGTGYQGIRIIDCTDVTVLKAYFPAVSVQYVIPIFLAQFALTLKDCHVTKTIIKGAFDNGIYFVAGERCSAIDNTTTVDSTGVVMTGTDSTIGSTVGNIVIGNICTPGPGAGASTAGINMRDSNNSICDNNHVDGYSVGIQLKPVQFDSASNVMNDNSICNNVITGWTKHAIQHSKVGLNLGGSSNNKICGNILIAGTVAADSDAINSAFGQQGGADIAFDNDYSNNTIVGGGNTAIVLSNQQRPMINNNKILNPAVSGAAQGTGIFVGTCTKASVKNNQITDTTGFASSGIDGNNTCVESDFINNTVRGIDPTKAPIRRVQQASNKNSFSGNRTGSDPLTGTITLGALANTVITNNNINVGLGYTSFVLLQPINQTAGTLIGSSKSPIIDEANHVDKTSFTIKTADGVAAAGNEQFYFEIRQ